MRRMLFLERMTSRSTIKGKDNDDTYAVLSF